MNKILFVPPFPLSTQPLFFFVCCFLFVVFLAFSLWWIHTVPNIKMKGKYFQSQTTHLHHPVPCPVSSPPQPPACPSPCPFATPNLQTATNSPFLPSPSPLPPPLLQFPLYLKATCLVLFMRALSRKSPLPPCTSLPNLVWYRSRADLV